MGAVPRHFRRGAKLLTPGQDGLGIATRGERVMGERGPCGLTIYGALVLERSPLTGGIEVRHYACKFLLASSMSLRKLSKILLMPWLSLGATTAHALMPCVIQGLSASFGRRVHLLRPHGNSNASVMSDTSTLCLFYPIDAERPHGHNRNAHCPAHMSYQYSPRTSFGSRLHPCSSATS